MSGVDLGIIKDLCRQKGISIATLEKELGFGGKSMFKWATSSPSVDKAQAVADYFNVSVDYLLGRESKEQALQRAFERPGMRMLFSVTEDCSAEEIEQAIKIIEALKK